MRCGLVGSLPTLTAILALSADGPAVGVKVTAIVQVELADAVPPHVPPVTAKSPAFGPVVLLSLTDSENADKLVTVMFLVFVGVLAVNVQNASVVAGDTVAGIFSPVVNETVYGPSVSGRSPTVIIADSEPSCVGA
jgi:hypothetical protein